MESAMESFLSAIEQNAKRTITPEDGDYLVDGLLYCHKCHTPKQIRIEFMGEVRTPMCLCKCAAEEQERIAREVKEKEKQEEIRRMRQIGFPDQEMRDWTFANDDRANPRASDACRKYADLFDDFKKKGKGLMLYGGVGTGKTFLSACIANELINKGHPCLMTSFPRIVNNIQSPQGDKQEYIDSLQHYELMVVDDLSAERNTDYMMEMIHNVIDSRYRAGLPIIVTTNLTAEELKNTSEIQRQRIFSRLFEMCIPIKVDGIDRRKQKLIDEYKAARVLLGL